MRSATRKRSPFTNRRSRSIPGTSTSAPILELRCGTRGSPTKRWRSIDKSLGIDASHAQTLFNIGIVRADGKRNYAGAIAVWETLLKLNPGYPEVAKVKNLITDAHTKTST